MDWQKEIDKFHHLDASKIKKFALPSEMEQALATYNKALDLLAIDSFDIALISLKKLAASYPLFAQAAFLLACCLMKSGYYEEAQEHLEHARILEMEPHEHERVVACLEHINDGLQQQLDLEKQAETQKNKSKRRASFWPRRPQEPVAELEQIIPEEEMTKPVISDLPSSGSNILQATGRRKRLKMASEKEKKDVIRQGEYPEEEETYIVEDHDSMEFVRKALPVAAIILLISLLIWGGFLIADSLRKRSAKPDDSARLAWLEKHISALAKENDDVLLLLEEYNHFINPPASSESENETTFIDESTQVADQTTQTDTQASSSEPAIITSETKSQAEIDEEALKEAFAVYKEAFELQNQDQIEAAELLEAYIDDKKEIPISATVEVELDDNKVTSISGEQLKTDVSSLYAIVAPKAADKLRQSGRNYFGQELYQEALADYLQAFKFDPDNYGGNVAYYCGRSYQELEQFNEAKPYFQYVIDNFPGSELAGYASMRLEIMGF